MKTKQKEIWLFFDREMGILNLIPEMGFKSLVIVLHHLFFSYELCLGTDPSSCCTLEKENVFPLFCDRTWAALPFGGLYGFVSQCWFGLQEGQF